MKLVLLSLLATAEARRHLHNDDFQLKRLAMKSNDQNLNAALGTQNSPLVEATDGTNMCMFYDRSGATKWCFLF